MKVEDRVRVATMMPATRLNNEREFLADFTAQKYAFCAQFGADKSPLFEESIRIVNDIFAACEELADTEPLPTSERKMELRRIVSRREKNDPIKPRLDGIVARMTAVCAPVIEAIEKGRRR